MENPLPILHVEGISMACWVEYILYKIRYIFREKPLENCAFRKNFNRRQVQPIRFTPTPINVCVKIFFVHSLCFLFRGQGLESFWKYLVNPDSNLHSLSDKTSKLLNSSSVIYPKSIATSSWLSTSIREAQLNSRKCIFSL